MYNGTTNQFDTVNFGKVVDSSGAIVDNPTGKFYELFNFGATAATQPVGTTFPWLQGVTGKEAYKAMADNSLAGEMRDCAECHVGGGMHEYVMTMTTPYAPANRTELRGFNFNGLVTSLNYFIDIFNPDPALRGEAVEQVYSETGVLEMDCLMCHQTGYDWEARKEAVRKGEFDASRAVGAGLTHLVKNASGQVTNTGAANGTTVFYNYTAVKTNAAGKLFVDLGLSLNKKPQSSNCAACHQSEYNVDWKKRGEQWLPGTEVHQSLGCMACHQRTDKANPTIGTTGVQPPTGKDLLGLCDPAKGGASAFDALWNKLDSVNFKECSSCHEPTATPTYETYGAPNSAPAHTAKGLNAKIAYDKAGNPVSHIQLIDCTACHIRKNFSGGAFVDGTGADLEGRVALHDEPNVSKNMGGTNGNALYWDNGKLYAANLLTSFFIRDMNGMDTANNGLDANNDGRNAGMDPLLQTHVNDINIANNRVAITHATNADGSFVNETEVAGLFSAIKGDGKGLASTTDPTKYSGGVKQLLGLNDPNNDKKILPKISFLMVPFKASHNIAPTVAGAWGKTGCSDCHGQDKGFYNGAYPVRGNMDGVDGSGNYLFRFKSNQVTAFTKVNGLADVTDSHPNVVTKKGDRTVPVPMLTTFDTPYTPDASATGNVTLRNIDRSEVIYESTFQTRNDAWATTITGTVPKASCVKGSAFYCATPSGVVGEEFKSLATSTKGWLLKVEVRSVKDNGDDKKIWFRTAQLGKDNATTMAEVVTALPASFKDNPDFTVAESNGAIVIAVKANETDPKEIRLSTQTDAAPFGLAGSVWKADEIVRGEAKYAGRDAFVAYLNTLTDAAAFGVGIDPKASINLPLADDSATQSGVQWATGSVHSVSAPYAQPNAATNPTGDAGRVTYTWSTNDNAEITNANSRDGAQIKFLTTGSKVIKLTVTDEEGKSSSTFVSLTAIAPPIAITWAKPTATFSNLPAGTTTVSISWGDGTSTLVKNANTIIVDNTLTQTHTYTSTTSKVVKVYCYSLTGSSLGYMQATINPGL
ncbi:PKD domain-containing protein [Geomonas anaerohicana]|uniref:PKD domain-containing protein n=1 Tax=Geomonas anaerohicana TaxID=2798583 RepID=A0ABS0YGY8_9BACT|nr:PKD domain-containing protein [Geomonas anaerohicana]MBJ6751522.1 PKD domain-containing protein [Geomonas anaerohicana]